MTKRNQYFLLLIILTLVSYNQIELVKANERSNNHFISFQTNDSVKAKEDSVRWLAPKKFSPLSFIQGLKVPNEVKQHSISLTTMADDFPNDWVKPSDLDSLISLIGSTTKCNCLLNPLSSYIPTNETADIGGYAIIFINSFRQKKRISLGLYKCPKTNKESVDEIMKWWTNFKLTK
jgi:hypothetical protein